MLEVMQVFFGSAREFDQSYRPKLLCTLAMMMSAPTNTYKNVMPTAEGATVDTIIEGNIRDVMRRD